MDNTMEYKIKTRNHPRDGTKVCYRVPNKQKPNTIPSRKCSNRVWALLVQLVA